jgi:PTS system ascorbate-specific IIC component
MIVQATIATYVVYRFLATPMILTIVIAALIVSIYWGVMSTLLIKPTEAVTNGAGFTIGHQQMLADYITYKIAGKIGSPENNVEKLRLPTWLSIIQDNVAASSILLLVAASAMMFVMGQETVMKMAAGKNWVIYIFTTGLTLAADLYVLMQGVRLFVGELMVLFTGISERLLPGAIVAVDCVAIFGFAPKAVLLGVVCAAIGQIVGITGLIIFKCPILIIPGFIPLFFDNATIGVFANRFGGWRAAAVLPFCSGMLQVTGTALAASMMQLNFWQGSFDYATLWVVIIAIFRFIGRALGITPL